MKVIFFGIYSKAPEYPRYHNLCNGLRDNGIQVIECHYPMAATFKERIRGSRSKMAKMSYGLKLLASYFSLSFQFFKAPHADAVLVAYPGYFHLHLARFLKMFKNRRAPLLFDMFFSLYDALVMDRKIFSEKSFPARAVYGLEKSACKRADRVLLDTAAHADAMAGEYRIDRSKFTYVYVGSAIDRYPDPAPPRCSGSGFHVLFVGTYIPLHGIEFILGAARELMNTPDIRFLMVGSGQLKARMESLAKEWELANVAFQDWVATDELGELIRSHDLSLGIFGTTAKAQRVIPTKIFDICCAGAPFVTADTPAIAEVFQHKKNAYLIAPGDCQALAGAILEMKSAPGLRSRIAVEAHRIGREVFCRRNIGRDLAEIIDGKPTVSVDPLSSG